MSNIYNVHYEIVGAAREISAAYFEQIKAARRTHWEFINTVGGSGMRPSACGGLRSVLFKSLPQRWRKIGSDKGLIEAIPNRSSAAGKALSQQISELPKVPESSVLTAALGYPEILAIDTTKGIVYFPAAIEIILPETRHFLRIPRSADDGFQPDEAWLREIRESELMRIIEDHNTEVRRMKECAA